MFRPPDGKGRVQKGAAFPRQGQTAAPAILLIHEDLQKPAPLQGFQGGRQGRAIHSEKRGHGADARRLRAVQGHQQGKLTVVQVERAKGRVESPGEDTGSALRPETQAPVADFKGIGQVWHQIS